VRNAGKCNCSIETDKVDGILNANLMAIKLLYSVRSNYVCGKTEKEHATV